jgi:hypothetical protein
MCIVRQLSENLKRVVIKFQLKGNIDGAHYDLSIQDLGRVNRQRAHCAPMGTKAAIADIAKGTVLEQTGVLVDESVVNTDIPGMTVHDYNPELHQGGFQRTVTKGY